MRLLNRPNLRNHRAGYAQVGWMIVTMILQTMASSLLNKKEKSPLDDDKPTVLATRGSFVNWMVGRRMVGEVFAWAGGRKIESEPIEGGKGFGSSPEQDIFIEEGWHLLVVGEAFALQEIRQQGKTIFKGPITQASHPSGSSVDLGKEGAFDIYWGEKDQPINTFLGDVDRVGISSRWPSFCYIVWTRKRLGTSPTWQVIQYVMETRVSNTVLTQTVSYVPPTFTLTGSLLQASGVTAGGEGTGRYTIQNDVSSLLENGGRMETTNDVIGDLDQDILRISTRLVQDVAPIVPPALPPFSPGVYHTETDIFPVGGLPVGATSAARLQKYERGEDDGINFAHAIAELLFAKWPRGLGLDPNGPEPFDIASLEQLGLTSEAEGLVCSLIGASGEEAGSILGNALQDLGYMLPFDTLNSGRLKFQPVREATGTLPNISLDLQAETVPEQEIFMAELPNDRAIFTFSDREHGFSDMPIAIDEDGQASFLEHVSADSSTMPSVINFLSAAAIAERRSQESLAGGDLIPLLANRGARELIPGQAVTADGFADVLRVVEVDPQGDSGKVKVTCSVDIYGSKLSDFVNQQGGGQVVIQPPEPDVFRFVEVPAHLVNGATQRIIIPRIRAHALIGSAAIHLSPDNVTYTYLRDAPDVSFGGPLLDALPASDAALIETGPTFTALGPPDNAVVQDYSADLVSWRIGRQLAVIGDEVFFVRNVEPMGGDVWRLRGLVRTRYDTTRLTHSIGDNVFIFSNTVANFNDALLEPDRILFLKSQPSTTSGSVNIAGIVPDNRVLYGKGIKPMSCANLRLELPIKSVPAFETGDNMTLRWAYRSVINAKTGSGLQAAGNVTGVSPPDGQFQIEVSTLADVVVLSDITTTANYLLTNAALVAALGSEASFKFSVRNVKGSFSSDPITITVTLI